MKKEVIRNEILDLLRSRHIAFKHLVHKEALNSDSASLETGFDKREGIKSIILKGKKSGKNFLVCLLGHQQIDMGALSSVIGEKCEFEKAEAVKEKFGLEIGGIPPFGCLLGLPTYFDLTIREVKEVIFSPGLSTESLRMSTEDLIPMIQPTFGSFSKN